MRPILFRLSPGSDLKRSILQICAEEKVETGVIISAVGSLSEAVIRSAEATEVIHQKGPFELTSLSGTISHTKAHLHCSLFDKNMRSIGGHVCEGCVVYTTMEVCLLDLSSDFESSRIFDSKTGYDELSVIIK